MAVVKVAPAHIVQHFIAEEPIGHLASISIGSGGRGMKEGTSTTQQFVAGVAWGTTLSGQLGRAIVGGIVSGVICGAVVSAGDRVTCTNVTSGGGAASGAGKITPLNSITPQGTLPAVSGSLLLASGLMISGALSGKVGIDGTALIGPGGRISGVAGFMGEVPVFTGTAFNTARVLAKALDNGGMGSGIRILVGFCGG